jgi:hypothetical protein
MVRRKSRKMAHLGDGGRPSWRPVVGVVLPPLSHQSHKGGNLCALTGGAASNLIRLVPGVEESGTSHSRRTTEDEKDAPPRGDDR